MFSFDEEQFLSAGKLISEVNDSLNSMKSFSFSTGTISDNEVLDGVNQLQNQMNGICDGVSFVLDEIKTVEDIIRQYNDLAIEEPLGESIDLLDEQSLSDLREYIYRFNQKDAYNNFESYCYGEELTEEQRKSVETYISLFNRHNIEDERKMAFLLKKAAQQGCGYTVLSSLLASIYIDNPSEFQEQHGYSLFQEGMEEERQLNYDCLFVDTFLTVNDEKVQRMSETGRMSPTERYDVSFGSMGATASVLIGNYNSIFVETVQNDITAETYERIMRENEESNTQAAIAVSNFDLIPYGGNNDEAMHNNGGHWMPVLGVSDEGNLIVSSWGEEWELQGGETENGEDDGGLIFFVTGE